jgi:hypothetical protein
LWALPDLGDVLFPDCSERKKERKKGIVKKKKQFVNLP